MPVPGSDPLNIRQIGEVCIVNFANYPILDEQVAQNIRTQLVRLVDELGCRMLVLNFGCVEYLSSSTLGLLISLNKRMNTAGGKLILCNLTPKIFEVFEITQLHKILNILEGARDEDLHQILDTLKGTETGDPGRAENKLIPPKPSDNQVGA